MKVKIRVQWEYGREGVKKGIKGDKWGNYKQGSCAYDLVSNVQSSDDQI